MTKEEKEALIRALNNKIEHHAKLVKQYKAELKTVKSNNPDSDENIGNKPPIPKIIYWPI